MPRTKKIFYPGSYHHIYNRGGSRKPIFYCDDHYEFFVTLLGDAVKKYKIDVHAYVLMENHYHMFLCNASGKIVKAIHWMMSLFARKVNKDVGMDGPLYRDRYQSTLVDSDMYFLNLSRYIHQNPIKANYVKNAVDYPWSSMRYFTGCPKNGFPINTHSTLVHFNDSGEYVDYVQAGMDDVVNQFYNSPKVKSILGSSAFKDKIRKRFV